MQFRRVALICAAAALAVGCAPVIRNHGYTAPEEDIARIEVGQDTRGSVQRKIGRPAMTGIFDDDGWYYVSSKVEHLMYYAPRMAERTVVAITFDDSDVVASIEVLDLADGRDIALETDETPTHGRTLTIIEQALGNIGVITGDVFEQ